VNAAKEQALVSSGTCIMARHALRGATWWALPCSRDRHQRVAERCDAEVF
jgi:hypothetical protein